MAAAMLLLHIITGSLGLLSGILVVILKKGNALHIRLGMVFLLTMSLSAMSALYLSLVGKNVFLFMVGIFTLYLLSSGYRAQMAVRPPVPVKLADVLPAWTMLVFAALLTGYGLFALFSKGHFLGWVCLAFALIGGLLAREDLYFYHRKHIYRRKNVQMHLSRMTGAVIASFTAFLVVNNTFYPA